MLDNKAVAVVSHDAGGAEILSNWVARQPAPYLLVLEGPAEEIFKRKLGRLTTVSLQEAINQADWVLTGTSWPADLERRAIQLARQLGKKSISFLDHWGYYLERFKNDGAMVYPDEIWVGDEYALQIARRVISDVDIVQKPNPYFEDIEAQLVVLAEDRSEEQKPEKSILYVSAPLSRYATLKYGDKNYWGFTEDTAFRYFMDNISVLNHPTEIVVLRPHPSEIRSDYEWAVEEYAPNVRIGGRTDLLTEIHCADIVAGFNSMAMVIGLIAGKRIINALPPGKMGNSLPMAKIENLDDLLSSRKSHPHADGHLNTTYQYYDLSEDSRPLQFEGKLAVPSQNMDW
jgi:hypothetical protein